jgi:hypothetical protein
METPLIPQRASGTRSPYTEEEMYYLTHPETWKAQNAVVVAEVEVPLVPPLPRRQNAVGVAEVEASLVPPLPRRQNAVVGAEAITEAITEADGKMRSCSSLAEALEFLARFETTP